MPRNETIKSEDNIFLRLRTNNLNSVIGAGCLVIENTGRTGKWPGIFLVSGKSGNTSGYSLKFGMSGDFITQAIFVSVKCQENRKMFCEFTLPDISSNISTRISADVGCLVTGRTGKIQGFFKCQDNQRKRQAIRKN